MRMKALGANLPLRVIARLAGLVGRAHRHVEGQQQAARQPAVRSARRESSLCVTPMTVSYDCEPRRALDGRADAHVGAAAADVSRHGRVDVGVVRAAACVAASAAADMIWPDWQ